MIIFGALAYIVISFLVASLMIKFADGWETPGDFVFLFVTWPSVFFVVIALNVFSFILLYPKKFVIFWVNKIKD